VLQDALTGKTVHGTAFAIMGHSADKLEEHCVKCVNLEGIGIGCQPRRCALLSNYQQLVLSYAVSCGGLLLAWVGEQPRRSQLAR
jgi:hypothetical protein